MSTNRKSRISCDYKVRFSEAHEAMAAADRYMDQITLTNAPMQPYYCRFHSCWHIGHDWTKDRFRNIEYQMECVSRQRLRRQIQGLTRTLIGIEKELKIAA